MNMLMHVQTITLRNHSFAFFCNLAHCQSCNSTASSSLLGLHRCALHPDVSKGYADRYKHASKCTYLANNGLQAWNQHCCQKRQLCESACLLGPRWDAISRVHLTPGFQMAQEWPGRRDACMAAEEEAPFCAVNFS